MATDLKTVQDHPAAILERGNTVDIHSEVDAAKALRLYEQGKDVTFAALDNGALAEVKGAFDKAGDTPVGSPEWVDAMRDLYSAAQDLLGLSDN